MVRLCLSNWGSAEGLIKALPVPTDGLESWKQGVFSVCVYVKMLSVCVWEDASDCVCEVAYGCEFKTFKIMTTSHYKLF